MSLKYQIEFMDIQKIINVIVKYKGVDNHWKQRCLKEVRDRFNVDISIEQKDIDETIEKLQETFPECFI